MSLNRVEKETAQKGYVDVSSVHSNQTGFKKLFELSLRRFSTVTFILAIIPIYLLGTIVVGIALTPSIYFFNWFTTIIAHLPTPFHHILLGACLFSCFLLYGLTIIFVVPFFNFIIPLKLKPARGSYYSYQSLPWFIHNALIYLVRYTFLDFITPTPLNILFYRLMGMKIGKNCQINTTNISDACLIELGDNVTIGGSATLFCHYASKGFLVIAPVKIGKNTTVGIKSTVMGDVTIGERSLIAPHEVILPKSRLTANYRRGNGNKSEKDWPSPLMQSS